MRTNALARCTVSVACICATLHAGETIVPANVTRALSRAGSQPPVVNINVEIQGDLYGDESSYARLYQTLERIGNKIGRARGVNTVHITV